MERKNLSEMENGDGSATENDKVQPPPNNFLTKTVIPVSRTGPY